MGAKTSQTLLPQFFSQGNETFVEFCPMGASTKVTCQIFKILTCRKILKY